MGNVIEIQHLYKSFGEVKAVQDLSFRVKEGDLFVRPAAKRRRQRKNQRVRTHREPGEGQAGAGRGVSELGAG